MTATYVYAVIAPDIECPTVLCVCLTSSDADELSARIGGGAYVDQIMVCSADVQQVKYFRVSVAIHDDGTETHRQDSATYIWPFDEVDAIGWRWTGPLGSGNGVLTVDGTDRAVVDSAMARLTDILKTNRAAYDRKFASGATDDFSTLTGATA